MRRLRMLVQIALVACGLLSGGVANATDISGTISSTLMILNDSELTGDVTCAVVNGPCITFGADDIKLRLKGFTITGLADPTQGCGATSATTHGGEIAIDTASHSHLEILGPGLVRNVRGIGILVVGGTKVKVRGVTTSTNCVCGILLTGGTSDNDVEDNIVVRIGNFTSPCGGINVTANDNRVRGNLIGGNGYVNATNNNFGIKINGTGNRIQENSVIGNANGILLTATAQDNEIRQNVATGNPPIEAVEISPTSATDYDIANFASAGANTFKDNVCLTSNVTGLCPNLGERREQ